MSDDWLAVGDGDGVGAGVATTEGCWVVAAEAVGVVAELPQLPRTRTVTAKIASRFVRAISPFLHRLRMGGRSTIVRTP